MNKLYLATLLLLSGFLIFTDRLCAKDNSQQFYFFSKEDISTIKKSAASEWGKLIVKGFKNEIKEREKYSMDIPKTAFWVIAFNSSNGTLWMKKILVSNFFAVTLF